MKLLAAFVAGFLAACAAAPFLPLSVWFESEDGPCGH